MKREELQILFSDLADKYFPKNKCKERGNLLVFIAEAIIALEGMTGKEKECPTCKGTGDINVGVERSIECDSCNGTGRQKNKKA